MARKRQKTFERLISELFKDEKWLRELKPAELLRMLQLYRESKELLTGDRRPKEMNIRWIEPEEDQ
jgi:hypothetical protein